MESTNIERQATRVIKKLRHYGCTVVETKRTPRGAIIQITGATSEMTKRAACINQTLLGVTSQILTLNIDGCTVRWNGGCNDYC